MRASHLIASSFIVLQAAGVPAQAQETVNPQVTDAASEANAETLGDAPALSEGNLFQATSQALGNAAHNATTAQQGTNVTAQAATTQGVTSLYSVDTASTEAATQEIFGTTAAEPD